MSNLLKSPTPEEFLQLKKWRTSVFWVCLVGYIGYYLCRKNISAAFPLMSETFGYTNTELGLIAFYSELAYAAGKLINGPLADKLGGRRFFLLGMLGAITCNLLFTLGNSLIYFILIWCLCRFFLSMGWGGLVKMIGHWYEPSRNGTIMGLISLNFQFGGVLATLFAALLVTLGADWKGVFIYPALTLTIIFFLSFFTSKEKPQDVISNTNFAQTESVTQVSQNDEQSSFEIIRSLLKLNTFKYVLVFSFITTFLRSIFFFWTPKLLTDLGMGTSNAILKSALFPFLGCLGTILLGYYTDKYARNDRAKAIWVMLIGLILSLLGISWCMSIGNQNETIVFLLGLCGFFLLGPYSMSSGCLTLDIAGPKAAGSATGMIDGLGYIGGALAVWGAGKLSDTLGWTQVFQILTIFAALATFNAFLLSREFQKQNQHII